MNQLLKETKDPEKKKYLLNYYIQQIQGTFYTQAMFSEFEHTIHQKMEAGEPVSAEGHAEDLPRHLSGVRRAGRLHRPQQRHDLGADLALLPLVLRVPVRHELHGGGLRGPPDH